MNLMFWKKKAATEDSQGIPQEKPDDNVVSHKISDINPADLESSDAKAPVKPGLVTRIKSKFTALALRFKKSPASKVSAEKNQDGDTHRRTKDEAAGTEGTPEKPGLIARIKSGFAALSLRLKKSSAPKGAAEEQSKDATRRAENKAENTEDAPLKPGLADRVKTKLVPLVLHYKKHLLITLVFMLLIGIVYAAWDIIFPPLVRKPAPHDAASDSQIHAPAPTIEPTESTEPTQAVSPQTEAEVLKKKSDEAQARAEALKKESLEAQAQAEALKKESDEAQAKTEAIKKKNDEARAQAKALREKKDEERARAHKKAPLQQQSFGSTAKQAGTSAKPSTGSIEMTVGNKDPKAAAMTLKEAIETMNDKPGEHARTPAK